MNFVDFSSMTFWGQNVPTPPNSILLYIPCCENQFSLKDLNKSEIYVFAAKVRFMIVSRANQTLKSISNTHECLGFQGICINHHPTKNYLH